MIKVLWSHHVPTTRLLRAQSIQIKWLGYLLPIKFLIFPSARFNLTIFAAYFSHPFIWISSKISLGHGKKCPVSWRVVILPWICPLDIWEQPLPQIAWLKALLRGFLPATPPHKSGLASARERVLLFLTALSQKSTPVGNWRNLFGGCGQTWFRTVGLWGHPASLVWEWVSRRTL